MFTDKQISFPCQKNTLSFMQCRNATWSSTPPAEWQETIGFSVKRSRNLTKFESCLARLSKSEPGTALLLNGNGLDGPGSRSTRAAQELRRNGGGASFGGFA